MFQMLGERSITRSRVKAGMARARIHGTKSGKPIGQQPLAWHKVEQIRAELQKGDWHPQNRAVVRDRRICGAADQAGDGGVRRDQRKRRTASGGNDMLTSAATAFPRLIAKRWP